LTEAAADTALEVDNAHRARATGHHGARLFVERLPPNHFLSPHTAGKLNFQPIFLLSKNLTVEFYVVC
jgi:hypothetical protein